VRLANCAFHYDKWNHGNYPNRPDIGFFFQATGGRPAEIVNCFHPGPVYADLVAGTLHVRNSVIGCLGLNGTEGAAKRQVELDRCMVWAPGSGFPDQQVVGTALRIGDVSEIDAHDTLFEAGFCMLAAPKIPSWHGSRNLYRLNGYRFVVGTAQGLPWLPSLDAWRAQTKSDEKGSAEGDALDLDPLQWQLLPSSPGEGQGPDGTGHGADVKLVAPQARCPPPLSTS
jgi:hypothetical protein